MAKTKQIGVRFTQELLEATGLTPQRALNLYEESHAKILGQKGNESISKVVYSTSTDKSFDAEKTDKIKHDEIGQWEEPKKEVDSTKHQLWKEGDPKEGSGSFFLKYGCFTYKELELK